MAIKDCDKISNIIAVAIAAGDDDLAKNLAELAIIKNDALQRSRKIEAAGLKKDELTGMTPHTLELKATSADIQIRAIVQAAILKGVKGDEALFELAKQIKETKGNVAGGMNLLESVRNASLADYKEVARLWDGSKSSVDAIKDLEDNLVEYISANYSISKYNDFYNGELSKAKAELKDKKITEKEYKKRVLNAHKEAMDKIAKGENPSGFVPLDKEWQAIKKVYGDDPSKAKEAWTQYIMARTLLSDGGLDDSIIDVFKKEGKNLLSPLTENRIRECIDLDLLMARAFTNTKQLYEDGILREIYRDKLTQLASGLKITDDNSKKIRSLINISLFAEEGATLSEVMLDNRAFMSMKQMGFKVSERDGRKILNGIKDFAKKLGENEDGLLDTAINIAGHDLEPRHLLQIIYDITGDKEIIKLVQSGLFTDGAILGIATQKLLGNNEAAKVGLTNLFKKGAEGFNISDSRGIFLMAISGIEVPAGSKIAFYDYRKGLYYKDNLSESKAVLMDKIAEKNKMKVDDSGIKNLTKDWEDTKENIEKLANELKEKAGGGYLIVNDASFNDNPLLRKALGKLKEKDAITPIYPRGGLMSNFSMEDGVVYFKTIDDDVFDDVAGKVSIQSMGQARPTKEILEAAYESSTGKNGEWIGIEAAMHQGTTDDFFENHNGYVSLNKSTEDLWREDGYATLYDILKNGRYEGKLSILGKDKIEARTASKEAFDKYKKIKIDGDKVPKIKIYRVTNENVDKIENGKYITPSKTFAKQMNEDRYGGAGKIIEELVPIDRIWLRKDKTIEEGCLFFSKGEIDSAFEKAALPTNMEEATLKYNKELDEAAITYFGKVLGISGKIADADYTMRVKTMLSDMLGIDVKTFDEFPNKSKLWQRIDKQLTLERLTVGKFDKEVIDIGVERERILNLSKEELQNEISKKFGKLVRGEISDENVNLIRESWFDYNTAKDTTELLAAKGHIISTLNGGNVTSMSIDDIKNMFKNKTFKDKYKGMFFPNQELDDADLKTFIEQINSDIFDGLSVGFAENLVRAGYSLPLMNPKKLVYDFLNGKLDLNSEFVQAFFFKNDIAFTKDNLESIVNAMMPKEFVFNSGKFPDAKLFDDSIAGDFMRVVESNNRFLPDSYSALYAIEDAGNAIMLGGKEYEILEGILDKYVNNTLKGMSEGTLSFGDAQGLKQELGYALDTFEQDYLLPKYGKFLTPQQRQAILGMKYDMPIGVTGQPYTKVQEMLVNAKERIMDGYRRTLGDMVDNNDINAAILKGYNPNLVDSKTAERIERRRNQLIEKGATIKEVNGEFIVYDSKDALRDAINSLPNSIKGLDSLKAMGRDGIEEMTNQQAYIVLRYIEATKALNTTANYATQLMYKQSPQLAQYSFFSKFAIDPETKLPKVMKGNPLLADEFFDGIESLEIIDIGIKKDVFSKVVNAFRKEGYISLDGLSRMIKESIKEEIDGLNILKMSPSDIEIAKLKMQNTYTNLFTPYTYLRDIPDGGKTQNGTKLVNVKGKVESTMKAAYNKALEDLEFAGAKDSDAIQNAIYVSLDDGRILSLTDLAKENPDSWKKQIFGDESINVRGADEERIFVTDDTMTLDEQTKILNEEQVEMERVQNEYLGTLQSILNQGQIIGEAERNLMVSFMADIRTDLRKYSLTNKLVDALDATSGLGEEAARGIKNYLIGFRASMTFGKVGAADIIERYKLVRDIYSKYYDMSLNQIGKITPKNEAEELALSLVKYFKNLERQLGSADGLVGVTTSESVNKAFYHIGETFMNLSTDVKKDGVKGIFSFLSAVEQNQVLKYFKFSSRGKKSYVEEFVQVRPGDAGAKGALGGYRDYVEKISGITKEDFNKLFGTNYSEKVFSRVLQGLTGFSMSGGGLARVANRVFDTLSGSWMLFRMLMSYPGQLFTIPQQGVAYFLKQIGFEQELGIESLADIDEIREAFGILDGAYNELVKRGKTNFNPDSKDLSSFYNRYGIPDVGKYYRESGITLSDDYINMYAKLDSEYSKGDKTMEIIKWFDPYKDNANNFIDGIFARNFKNVAFVKGLKENGFMKFSDAKSFYEFMSDPKVSAEVKERLLDAVSASAGRNFRNILGLGFGGMDRAVGGSGFQNVLFGWMQLFNFRGSWGQNIFKQSGVGIYNMLRRVRKNIFSLDRQAQDEFARYVVQSPEFVNFTTALLHDLERSFKLTRYQDNGRWPDEEEDGIYYFLDYLGFIGENLNMVSQRWQGIQSFGPARPFLEQGASAFRSAKDPTIYKDTLGLGAWFNAVWKNFIRQWKPVNWITEMIGALESGGPSNVRAYIFNRWMNLSFGSMRYMISEDSNAYGYTYQISGQRGGIPGVVMGEAELDSDKVFLYELDANETWDNILAFVDGDLSWDTRKVYAGNLWKTMVNGSQFMTSLKNIWKVGPLGEYTKMFYTNEDLGEVVQKTKAGAEFYSKGYVTPNTSAEAHTFFDIILKNAQYRPGSKQFNKSIIQFDTFGHMDGDKGNAADAEMELWLEHMKYETNEKGEFILENGKKVVDSSWTKLIENIKNNGGNEDYVVTTIYNYSKKRLDDHNKDPNYPLYIKMLGQGHAYMLIDREMDKRIKELNVGATKETKWTEAKFKKFKYDDMLLEMGKSMLEGDTMTLFDRLNRLDSDNGTVAALKIIQGQATEQDRKIIDKFFKVETKVIDGEEVDYITLSPQYKNMLEQSASINRALDEGNIDRALVAASSLANTFKNNDPAGIITANMIDSIYNRVYGMSSLPDKMKQEIMIGVFYDNKEFIQRNASKMREMIGDDYDVFANLMNEMIYNWDSKLISTLESIQSSGDKDAEKVGKKTRKASRALKDFGMSLGGSGSGGSGSGGSGSGGSGRRATGTYAQFVPTKIKGADLVKQLGLKGYSPSTKEIKAIILGHRAKLDLSLNKDINRKVKATKTQEVSNKKQLSKIESKATKAIEAES